MRKLKTVKTILACSVAAALGMAGSVAMAHTGVKDKVFIEGVGDTGGYNQAAPGATAYTAFTVTHGCLTNAVAEGTAGAVHRNVIAVASLFPNSTKVSDALIYRYMSGSTKAGVAGVDGTVLTGTPNTLPVDSPADLSSEIVGATAGAALNNFGLGLVSPNLFGNVMFPKIDAAGTTRGFAVTQGPIPKYNLWNAPLEQDIISTTGLVSFKFTVPKFNANSCVKNLVVRIAVSNWCTRGGGKPTYDPSRKDVWIGTDTGSVLYSMLGPDNGVMPYSQSALGITDPKTSSAQGNGSSFWPSFTVTRDLVNNPLPARCNGQSYDIAVSPSGADIDTNLTIAHGVYPNGDPGAAFQ